jgi:hypothetical protein
MHWKAQHQSLFILDDYGGNGCYYLGENRDFFVEKSTIDLIRSISSERGIDSDHIIAGGRVKADMPHCILRFDMDSVLQSAVGSRACWQLSGGISSGDGKADRRRVR